MDKLVRKQRLPQKIIGGPLAAEELEYVDVRTAERSDVTVARQPNSDSPQPSEKMRIAQNAAVSCVSASLAHVPHHPLYTLKTQMMFYGRGFRFRNFFTKAWESRGVFLMRGMLLITV